ncbi:MAG: ribosome biogenesis GTPase YlqF [Clostridiales bacterium]|nr:ribosome biogenesis GTPase YlqF [Clostridiales bacterium]
MDNNRFDSGTVIQWYPGHMAKTKRKIKECLALVDIIVEIIDARIPISSRNPDLRKLTAGKPSVILLNKSDIADEAATSEWIRYFREQNISALAVDCKSGRGLSGFLPLVKKVLADRIAQWKQKGMVSRPVRMMVAGIPNSGKSSFINRMSHGSKARVEDRPGVTRANQWFVTADGSQMLDTPGVLWPKFDDQRVARYLAFTGAIRDEILNIEELAYELLTLLKNDYSELLKSRYKLPEQLPDDSWELLQLIGKLRGMLISGGEVDTERASIMLFDEFRGGRIGRITLEKP